MKRNNLIINGLLVCSLLSGATACTNDYIDINQNPYEATQEDTQKDGYNISAALLAMEGNVIPSDVNSYQFIDALLGGSFGGYLADSNNGFINKYSTYNPKEDWLRAPFKDIIPKIYNNHKLLKTVTNDPVPLAVGEVVKIASLSRITDIHGPIPYTQIGKGGKLNAPYDSQETIYKTMLDSLDKSIETLTKYRTANFNAKADKVFNGNVEKWIKFSNSLKLRLAMRIVYAEPTLAQTKAEEAVNHPIGTIDSNSDNASLTVNKHPLRVIMYEYNGGDSRVSADITSYMNGFNDPRCAKYFTKSTFDGDNGYIGLRNGITIPSSEKAHKYSNFNISVDNKELLWMNAAEVAFLKAEGALRGWNMGDTAENLYHKGIQLSFDQWGASDYKNYVNNDSDTPEVYKDPLGAFSYSGQTSDITVKWEENADFERSLERIITQKWIANFPLGNEAWAEFRRTGYPKLMEVVVNGSDGIVNSKEMARRLNYPQEEYKENKENVEAAVSSWLGGKDTMATHNWWDCKNK